MCKKIIEMTEEELADLIEDKVRNVSTNMISKMYFDYRELSDYTGMSISKLKRLKKNGEIPYQQIGRSVLFNRKKIDLWILHNGEETDFTKRQVKRYKKYIK